MVEDTNRTLGELIWDAARELFQSDSENKELQALLAKHADMDFDAERAQASAHLSGRQFILGDGGGVRPHFQLSTLGGELMRAFSPHHSRIATVRPGPVAG